MLDQLYLLHELYPVLAATIDLVFGLLIGSFLNVVITRLPLILEQQWQQEAHFVLELESAEPALRLPVPRLRIQARRLRRAGPGAEAPETGQGRDR